jgi:SAM-dependent methyltransferase
MHATAAPSDDYRWLISPAAEPWLRRASESPHTSAASVAQLRRELSSDRAHLVLEQIALRARAREKFSAADRMFFTARGLEQSTDEVVAAYKAARFEPGACATDLCSGVGGDLLALVRRGDATGCDRDPIMALLAAANAAALASGEPPRAAPTVCTCDVENVDVSRCAAWHIDPDRRPRGRRTTHVDAHEPGPVAIARLLDRNPHGAVKLAPAAHLPETWPQRAELEWISRGRECRQLVAWFGALARDPGKRRATVLGRAGVAVRSILEARESHAPAVAPIGRYVFEPDPAVLAAGLGPTLAAEHALSAIAAGSAYWTGEQPLVDPALACFEVIEVLPFRVKTLKSLLRARDVGQLEIKKRNVDIDPAGTRRQLAPKGSQAATLLVTRIEKRVTAILARRLSDC